MRPAAFRLYIHLRLLNHELQISVGTVGPQLRAPHTSGHCQAERMPERIPERISERMPDGMSDAMSEWMPDRMLESMPE